MRLRKKTLIIIGLTLIGLISILYAASITIVMNGFVTLEEQNTQQNVERVLNALETEKTSLDSLAYDWACWDGTYEFVEDQNPEYIDWNLVDETFAGARFNLIMIFNSSDQLVFGKAYDLEEDREIPIPQSFYGHLTSNSLLLNHEDIESTLNGVILLPEEPMIISSRPILTSEDEGPIRGTLIMGRFFDAAKIAELSATTQLPLSMYKFNDDNLPTDFQIARSSFLEGETSFVQPMDADTIAGYALINDIYGKPVLITGVTTPRDIYAQGKNSIFYFFLFLLATGVAFGIGVMVLLEKNVLSRLALLSREVRKIGERGEPSARIPVEGNDELSRIGEWINEMVELLENSIKQFRRAHDELEERVYERTAELEQANEALQAEIQERKKLIVELETRNAEMEQFVYTVSHDLQTPLVTIQGFAGLMLEDVKLEKLETVEKNLKHIEKAAGRMGTLLKDTLELSRIGRVANPPEEVAYSEIVQEALEQTAERIKANGIEVSVAEDFPAVHVDRRRIIEMLVNLIENSINYRDKQNHPKIDLGYQPNGGETAFFVRDNGIGIDSSQHEKVFKLFYKEDGHSPGTGVGLAIVKRIIEVHNGQIWIESEKGKGCTIWFTLPGAS
jgi:sensor domain CHASE-containing protein/nitrogen-specific signal transduction histidine kinase